MGHTLFFINSIWLSWKIKVQMSREALLSCLSWGTIFHIELNHSRAHKYPSLAIVSFGRLMAGNAHKFD